MALDIVKNREDAEDVVQESFVKAFLSLDKFKGESSFFTWLYRIAFNMAVDVKRKSARRGGNHVEYKESLGVSPSGSSEADSGGSLGAPVQHVEGPHEALARKQAGRKIQKVLSELSEDHRAVITLREIDGLNYEEISEALGIPRGTVMSRLFYARKALQKALREFAPETTSSEAGSDEQTEPRNEQRLKKTIG
jgi:RNA polymerase sigma-70 factor (ECF subfamily)